MLTPLSAVMSLRGREKDWEPFLLLKTCMVRKCMEVEQSTEYSQYKYFKCLASWDCGRRKHVSHCNPAIATLLE